MSTGANVAQLEEEIAEVCGIVNVATGRLVPLIGKVLDTESYAGAGIRSPEHELPETRAALEGGELAEDQVAVICRHTPTHNDAEVAELARAATVSQLRRTLGRHTFAKPTPDPGPEPEPDARRVNFGFGDDGSFRLSAVLPADEGALLERALGVYRQKLFGGEADRSDAPKVVSWADALVAMAEASLAAEAIARPHYGRHLVVVHVGTDDTGAANGHLHLGPRPSRRPAPVHDLRRQGPGAARRQGQAPQRGAHRPHRCQSHPPGRRRTRRRLSGPGMVTAKSGCTRTTWCTGKTAGPPTPRI